MGKGRGCNVTRHAGHDPRGDTLRCIRCGVLIIYGQHCQECGRKLRLRGKRQRRKAR